MSTEYGFINCARYGDHKLEIYTTIGNEGINLFATRDFDVVGARPSQYPEGRVGVKFVLDENNIDDFLGAIATALKERNIFSNYLNPEGEKK